MGPRRMAPPLQTHTHMHTLQTSFPDSTRSKGPRKERAAQSQLVVLMGGWSLVVGALQVIQQYVDVFSQGRTRPIKAVCLETHWDELRGQLQGGAEVRRLCCQHYLVSLCPPSLSFSNVLTKLRPPACHAVIRPHCMRFGIIAAVHSSSAIFPVST